MASVALRPMAMMDAAADQVATVTRSENQYNTKVVRVQVRRSTGTGS
jgi:hypothetical protein